MTTAKAEFENAPPSIVGRYAIYDELASGGMATVYLGQAAGAGGFSRMVAIKRLHPQFAKDQEFKTMFLDEARLAARIHHPRVVQTLDVVATDKELLLVMEYVHGLALGQLLGAARRAAKPAPAKVVASIVIDALEGLHAAHEATNELGQALGVVHRDVSPQNILVGAEGQARILDFGVAKAMGKVHNTREGQLKGKLQYMAPEQVRGQEVERRTDLFAMGIVLWEALVGESLFRSRNAADLILQVLEAPIDPLRVRRPDLPVALEEVVSRGVSREIDGRFPDARAMATAIEEAIGVASPREVAAWVESVGGDVLASRTAMVAQVERKAASAPRPQAASPSETDSGLRTKPSAVSASPEPSGGARAPAPVTVIEPRGHTPARFNDPLSEPRPLPPFEARADGSSPRLRRPMTVPGIKFRGPSLWDRLKSPLLLVGAGVVISMLDAPLQPYTAGFPIRILWVAQASLIIGVLWVVVRLVRREE